MKTPKAQQTAEQPLTKKTGNYQKRYFTFKDIEEAKRDNKRDALVTSRVGDPQTAK